MISYNPLGSLLALAHVAGLQPHPLAECGDHQVLGLHTVARHEVGAGGPGGGLVRGAADDQQQRPGLALGLGGALEELEELVGVPVAALLSEEHHMRSHVIYDMSYMMNSI